MTTKFANSGPGGLLPIVRRPRRPLVVEETVVITPKEAVAQKSEVEQPKTENPQKTDNTANEEGQTE